MLKIDFRDENFKNLIVWGHKSESLDIWFVDLPSNRSFKLCPLHVLNRLI